MFFLDFIYFIIVSHNRSMENISKDIMIYIHYLRRKVPSIVFIYLGVILVHWVSSHLYPQMCCGNTLWGIIMSPFMTVTPHCEALRWTIHFTGEKIRNAWFWLAGYLVSYIGVKISPLFLSEKYYLSNQRNDNNIEHSPKRKSVRTNE